MVDVTIEHPDYRNLKRLWAMYRDLYVGGEQMRQNAALYLIPRQKEPADVYGERLRRVFYQNYIGSIIDWYAATLFRREPIVHVDGDDEVARTFYNSFIEDCDLQGTSLTEFFRRRLTEALVCGVSYMLVDFPRAAGRVGTRAEEEQTGASRGYLVECAPEAVINWSKDDRGELEWVVIRKKRERWGPDGQRYEIRQWTYYDRESFRVYQQRTQAGQAGGLVLVDEGRHALARQGRVPLFKLEVPQGFWLMNRAAQLQLEHFNKANALAWALTMGLFAMPVIYSDREWNQVIGESYYIHLGPEDRFGWTEPEGRVFEIAAENLTRLQEEIYRVCYLLSQAGGSFSSRALQSGVSKQRDFAITQEVLRTYGDLVKEAMKRVLRAIAEARQDQVAIDVSGLDEFDIGDFSAELEDAERLLRLGDASPTLKKQILKRLAFKYLCDVRQEIKDRIAAEIEAAEL